MPRHAWHNPAATFAGALFLLGLAAGPTVAVAQEKVIEQPSAKSAKLIDRLTDGRWGIGSQANCFKPRNTYTMTIAEKVVLWKDGDGTTYVESIVSSDLENFRTITVSSPSDAPGTRWTYTSLGEDRFRVTKNETVNFNVVKCR